MRVALHIVEKRRERLRDLIRTDGFLPLAEICRRLQVSEATARRDLATVAERGEITRTRGGALADYNTSFASHGEREDLARGAKGRVAAMALKAIRPGMCVFLDAGTTVQELARQLVGRTEAFPLTVATNSLSVATVLGGAPGIELHLLGGMFLHRQSLLLGPNAVRAVTAWRFDVACLGGEGVDRRGVSNSLEEIAVFQREVVARSERALFCLDASKVGRGTPHLVVDWQDRWELVTDADRRTLRAEGAFQAKQLFQKG